MAKKPLITPKGVLVWPHVEVPTFKYQSTTDKEYTTKILIDEDDAVEFNEMLDELAEESYQAAEDKLEAALEKAKKSKKVKEVNKAQKALDSLEKNPPYIINTDDDDNPTGQFVYTAKNNASGKREDGTTWEFKPTVFLADGKRLYKTVGIGSGSTARLSVNVNPYFVKGVAGITLKLQSTQLIKLEKFGGSNPFDVFEDEDAYEFSEEDVIESESNDGMEQEETDETSDF